MDGSTDNVGVTGYALFLDGVSAGTTTTTAFSFTGLGCGTSHVLGVQAFDAAGNVSPRATVTAATVAVPGRDGPDGTERAAAGVATTTTIPVTWTASTDNVGVAGYTLSAERRDGRHDHDDSLHVQRADLRHELHARRAGVRRGGQRLGAHDDHRVSTAACPDVTAPSAPAALAAGATTTSSIAALVDGVDATTSASRATPSTATA